MHKEEREMERKSSDNNEDSGAQSGSRWKQNSSSSIGIDSRLDPVAKTLIRESLSASTEYDEGGNHHNTATQPEDVLVFSRSVHKIDSSLQ